MVLLYMTNAHGTIKKIGIWWHPGKKCIKIKWTKRHQKDTEKYLNAGWTKCMVLKYNQYIHQEVRETYDKHIQNKKEINKCMKTSKPFCKEYNTENFSFDRDIR